MCIGFAVRLLASVCGKVERAAFALFLPSFNGRAVIKRAGWKKSDTRTTLNVGSQEAEWGTGWGGEEERGKQLISTARALPTFSLLGDPRLLPSLSFVSRYRSFSASCFLALSRCSLMRDTRDTVPISFFDLFGPFRSLPCARATTYVFHVIEWHRRSVRLLFSVAWERQRKQKRV